MKSNIVKDKSFEFSLKIILLFKMMQDQKEFIISKQILRSGTSIGANIAESEAAQSRIDFVHKLSIASKEARETVYWLQLLDKSELVNIEVNTHIKDCEEIIRLLTSIIKTIKSKL
ncbi:four helix bundle protein [Psychroflexus sp. CAK8W]|uniref:Four helix bundle protein n=1 Tax=Psychroflexus longus TaxID=2873596 RepID=A0ABS7XH22_9FLAO|nr:four helix bundle protein [Psychroflexus longus]MBZ9777317.1 four helix bundle protein [Psychroflexus longus]